MSGIARKNMSPRLLVPFLCLTLLPLAGLAWLSVRLIEQDRLVEEQRRQERFDRAVERVVTRVRQKLLSVQEQLRCAPPDRAWGEGFVIVEMGSQWTRVCAGGPLVWVADAPAAKEAPADMFSTGEFLEFGKQDPLGAAAEYRKLVDSRDPAVRAGALLRLARVLRVAGRSEEALKAYERMRDLHSVAAGGGPAALVAGRARCELLAKLGREAEARTDADSLAGDLDSGRWAIGQSLYEAYRSDLAAWSPRPPLAGRVQLARAVGQMRARWRTGQLGDEPAGSGWVQVDQVPLTVVWRNQEGRLWALIADASFAQRHWLGASREGLDLQIASAAPPGRKYLSAAFTGLPWPITVAWLTPPIEDREAALRRGLVLGLLGTAFVAILISGVLLWRTFSRERALARLQSDFVSTVSHEFRTPLTSMRQMTEALMEGRLLREDRRQTYYQALARATHRLQRLVESLLDFGRMEAGAMPYRMEPLDGATIVRALETDFASEFGKGGFRLAVTLPETCRTFRGDPDALTQALWNLLDNAVKYSRQPSTVYLDLESRDNHVRFLVRDEGIGIPAKERKLILARFARGKAAMEAGIRGTGIGLAIVNHVVRGHGGTLEVQSEPGRGSTFVITLPAEG